MATKKCNTCGREKSLHSFHNCKSCKDGKQTKCKICVSNYERRRKEQGKLERPRSYAARLTNPTIEDYRMMYQFFESIGYDPTKDIHEQFCLKHGLNPRQRPLRDKNKFSYDDCFNNGL